MNEKILTNEKILMQTEKKNTTGFTDSRKQEEITKKNGSSRWHNLISTNTIIAIGSRVRSNKCEIYSKDMCVQLNSEYFLYPDVVIVAGEPKFSSDETNTLLNPTLVVEVFSRETASYDKTIKLENYLSTESIREILLVSEDEMRVEHYFRQNHRQWIYRLYDLNDDLVSLESINCRISVAEIYAQVKLDQTAIKS